MSYLDELTDEVRDQIVPELWGDLGSFDTSGVFDSEVQRMAELTVHIATEITGLKLDDLQAEMEAGQLQPVSISSTFSSVSDLIKKFAAGQIVAHLKAEREQRRVAATVASCAE